MCGFRPCIAGQIWVTYAARAWQLKTGHIRWQFKTNCKTGINFTVCLIELYKALKFRTPYCVFELFQCITNATGRNLTLMIPAHTVRCQKQTFIYQTTLFWNKLHKKLLKPSTVKMHASHTNRLNLLDSECIFLDFSTKVATLKSGLKKYLFETQSSGGRTDWSTNNYISNG